MDCIAELQTACREAGVSLDLSSADGRFLLTTVVNFVKFARRRRLLRAIAHLSVTVMADRALDEILAGLPAAVRLAPFGHRSAEAHAGCEMHFCPTPHMTGFHERVLGALTAGAAVLATPNKKFCRPISSKAAISLSSLGRPTPRIVSSAFSAIPHGSTTWPIADEKRR